MKVLIPFIMLPFLLGAGTGPIKENPYTYEQLMAEVEDIKADGVEVGTIGKSEQGRTIPYIKIGNGKQHMLLIGTHHAREWITSQFLMKLVREYAEGYNLHGKVGEYPVSLLNEISIIAIPMLNPDGVMIQQKGLKATDINGNFKLWSMNHFSFNFSCWKANGQGIDLNRQYPSGWDELKKLPAWPSFKQYRGKNPAEAIEVQQLINFTEKIKPEIAIAYHTSGKEVYWYYKNSMDTIEKDFALAVQIAKKTGYELSFPQKDAVGGGYTDWFISTYHKPGFTIEMCESIEETNPPSSCLHSDWEGNKEVPLMLIDEMVKSHE